MDDIFTKNMDPSLMKVEVWNPYNVVLTFKIQKDKLQYLERNGRQTKIQYFELQPGRFIVLSHQYWNVESATGVKQPFLPMNLGRDIGKGIRWEPGPKDPGYEDWKRLKRTVNNG